MQTNLFGATDYKRSSYMHPDLLLFWEIKLNCTQPVLATAPNRFLGVSYETIIKYGRLFVNGEKDLASRVCQNIAHRTLDEALQYYRENVMLVEAADYILFNQEIQEIGCIQTRKNSYSEPNKCQEIEILCKKPRYEETVESPLFKQRTRILKRKPKTQLDEDHLKKVKKSDILVW